MSQSHSARLGEIADFVRGVTYRPGDLVEPGRDGVLCLRTGNIQKVLDLSDVVYLRPAAVKREDQRVRPGDILVSSANSWNLVGKCSWIPPLPIPATFGGFVTCVRPDPARVDPRYLYHWLSSPATQHVLRSFGRRTTSISNLNLNRTRDLMVPLPKISEQQTTAAKLDRVLDLAEQAASAKGLSEQLPAAIFFEMFGGSEHPPVTIGTSIPDHPAGWQWKPLTEVATLATGHTPDRKRDDYWGGDIPWLTLSDIRRLDGRVTRETSENITRAGVEGSSAVLLPVGTVCLSRTASVGFATVTGVEMATSQDFVNWICNDDLEPNYLMQALIEARPRIQSLSNGSTHKTVYFPTAKRLRVLVPPPSLQKRFSELATRARDLGDLQAERMNLAEGLAGSLTSRALGG